MLYIEASQINSNGGIVLLDLLLRRIKERNKIGRASCRERV